MFIHFSDRNTMTTKDYIDLISNGSLSLVKETATRKDELKLGANEYFAFLFCTTSKTYLRNYIQYKGRFNPNPKLKLFDLELDTLANTDEFFLSKIYDAANYHGQMGRIIIVSVAPTVVVHTIPPPAPVIIIVIPPPVVYPLLDIDGNEYDTIIIGNLEVTIQNLKVTHYSDGTAIPLISDNTLWSEDTIGAHCWYNNDIGYKNPYGGIYNWYTAINSHGLVYFTRNGLKEYGWRVPTHDDMVAIRQLLGGVSIAGGHMKQTGLSHWNLQTIGTDNSSGFSGIGAGMRAGDTGNFEELTEELFMWCSDMSDPTQGDSSYLTSTSDAFVIYPFSADLNDGFSIRCVRDTNITDDMKYKNTYNLSAGDNTIITVGITEPYGVMVIDSSGNDITDSLDINIPATWNNSFIISTTTPYNNVIIKILY
jgi:uncharacterized protein (TIGR02145 family)